MKQCAHAPPPAAIPTAMPHLPAQSSTAGLGAKESDKANSLAGLPQSSKKSGKKALQWMSNAYILHSQRAALQRSYLDKHCAVRFPVVKLGIFTLPSQGRSCAAGRLFHCMPGFVAINLPLPVPLAVPANHNKSERASHHSTLCSTACWCCAFFRRNLLDTNLREQQLAVTKQLGPGSCPANPREADTLEGAAASNPFLQP
jgi:hypothetical protein